MKGYRGFILVFLAVLTVYIVAEWNRPKPVDWSVTLSNEDKNPYGTYIAYQRLKDLFPTARIRSYRLPVYNQVNNFRGTNTAYILINPQIDLPGEDVVELMNYVARGNYAFISSGSFGKALADSLKINTLTRYDLGTEDSIRLNFVNARLHVPRAYAFNKLALNDYFEKIDTAGTFALANNHVGDVHFVRIPFRQGAFFVHTLPVCFSNYFMLTANNAQYAATALSYLPTHVTDIFWDEYYKLGPTGSQNPLRFILNNASLRWAFRIGLLTIILFILFEMKRRQRVIPVVEPFRNSTLDFVETVGNVYFNQRNNKDIAAKKISYFLEFIRSSLYLSTSHLDSQFVQALANRTGIAEGEVSKLFSLIHDIQNTDRLSDDLLIKLNHGIDEFYERAR